MQIMLIYRARRIKEEQNKRMKLAQAVTLLHSGLPCSNLGLPSKIMSYGKNQSPIFLWCDTDRVENKNELVGHRHTDSKVSS